MANEDHLAILRQGVEVWNAWRERNPDLLPDLRGAILSLIHIDPINSDLIIQDNLCLEGVNFSRVDLSGAKMSGINLSNANLSQAQLNGSDLIGGDCSGANFEAAILNGANINASNLKNVNLRKAFMVGASFRKAFLFGANLEESHLIRTQVLATNLTQALLTGACIEDWHLNSQTILNEIECDYIFLENGRRDRRPSDPNQNFAPGEFTKLFQEVHNTFNLILHNGMNWRAFALAFTEANTEVIDEYGGELFLRGYEILGDGLVKLKIEYPEGADKHKVKVLLEEKHELQIRNSKLEGKVEAYERMLFLPRPPERVIVQIGENNSVSDTFNNDFQGAKITNFANKLEDNARQQAIVNDFSVEQNLTEVTAAVHQILDRAVQANLNSEGAIVEAVHQEIKRNPTLRARLLGALKAGGLEALKAVFAHPVFTISAETVKGWLEAE